MKLLALLLLCTGTASAAESAAEALMLEGRVEEALVAARAEAAGAPSDLDAHERYIDLLLTKRRAAAAEQQYRERVAAAPTDPDAHYLYGRAVTTANAARDAYEKALRFDPEHARSHMGMGAVYRATGDAVASEAAYRRALALDRSLGEAWGGLGVALALQGRTEEAVRVAREAMVAVPGAGDPYVTVALLDPSQAEQVLAEGAKAAPRDPQIPVTLAEVRLARGDGTAASEALAAAAALAPRDLNVQMLSLYAVEVAAGSLDGPGYQALVAARNQSMGDAGGSLAALDKLVASYPSSALARMARAQPRAATGDSAGAVADLQAAHGLDPRSVEIRGSLGVLLASTGDAEAAVPHLRAAVEARPTDSSLVVALGRAEAETGAIEVARERLRTAWASSGGNVEVLLAYVAVLAAAQDSDTAYRVLSDAVARGNDSRIVLALAAAARDVGKFDEAASLVEELARRTGEQRLLVIAHQLRQQGAATPQ